MKQPTFDICQHFSDLSDDVLIDRNSTAKVIGTEPGTLANWACAGNFDLPVVMVGRLPRYRVGDIRAYIYRNKKVMVGARDIRSEQTQESLNQ